MAIKTKDKRSLSQDQFEAKIKEISPHVEVLTNYFNRVSKIKFKCTLDNHEWETCWGDYRGCRVCANINKRISHAEFKKRIKKQAPHLKLLSRYTHSWEPIKVKCNLCAYTWKVQARSLDRPDYGCPSCLINTKKYKLQENVIKLRLVKNNPTLSLPTYTSLKTNKKYEFTCSECSDKTIIKLGHAIDGASSCKNCGGHVGTSKISIQWLDSLNCDFSIQFGKGNEFKIPGHKWRVDGYSEKFNTVFEFLGDFWHGNLDIFAKDRDVFYKTALERYNNTRSRFIKIRKLGYNLVYIWENDYKNGLPPIVVGNKIVAGILGLDRYYTTLPLPKVL